MAHTAVSRILITKGRMMPPKKSQSIVDQLRQAIADSGETEYAIAKGSGVSQSVVNRFVHCERGISLDTAARLCSYLELKLSHQARR